MRGVLAEKDNDLSDANENKDYLETQLNEAENKIRSLEETLKERTSALQERIELGTSVDLEKESLSQEVRSAIDERDRLRNKVSEFESQVKQLSHDKEVSQQAYVELEVEVQKLRDSATAARKQHVQDQDNWRLDKSDLLNQISDLEAKTSGLTEKMQAWQQANEALKLAHRNEVEKLQSSHLAKVDELNREMSSMKSSSSSSSSVATSQDNSSGDIPSNESVQKLQVTKRRMICVCACLQTHIYYFNHKLKLKHKLCTVCLFLPSLALNCHIS
jgi:chromosome segregation ATPase